jgi:hypothetical protein
LARNQKVGFEWCPDNNDTKCFLAQFTGKKHGLDSFCYGTVGKIIILQIADRVVLHNVDKDSS